MAPRSTKLDLSLSAETLSSITKFLAALDASEKKAGAVTKNIKGSAQQMQLLLALAKKLSDVDKALTAKASMKNMDTVLAGKQAAANRKAATAVVEGTARGVTLKDERERARLADQLVKSGQEALKNQQAMELSTRRLCREAEHELDVLKLKNQLELANRRLGLETQAGDRRKISEAKLLVEATRARLAVLEKIAAVQLGETKNLSAAERAEAKRVASAQRALAKNPNQLPNFNAGLQTRVVTQAASTASLGSEQGAALASSNQRAAAADLLVRSAKAELMTSQALELSLRELIRSTKVLTDLQELKTLKTLTERRLGLEIDAGNVRKTLEAKRLLAVTEARIIALQREKALVAQTARTPKAIAERGRTLMNERLWGDGGANLFKTQAGLGANYLLINTLRTGLVDALTFSKELDSSLRQLQAIVVITDTGLAALKQTMLEIGENTRFSAVQLSDAAVILGQAGLSLSQIEQSIGAVAMLATATGTDLKQAVDLVTSVLGVFNLEAGQTANVTNVLTAAVNSSKLDIEKLALGLQYAGNTAADSGMNFEELTAALGAMSNAGIRSGSTLGTGMRQILISLQKPSKEFSGTMERLGLTMSDIDVRTNGLYGALQNLSNAGFTAGDAIKSFEVRGAAAYSALSQNLDQMLELESGFYDTTAAITANDTQMRSLESQSLRLGNTFKALVSSGLEPLLFLTRDVFQGLADMLSAVDQSGAGIRILTTAIAGLAVVGIASWAGNLAVGLYAATAAGEGLAAVMVSLKTLSLAPMLALGLGPMLPVILGITAALVIGGMAWRSYADEQARAATALEMSRTKLEESTGAVEDFAAKITTVTTKIQQLEDRSEALNADNRILQATVRAVKNEFIDMGLDVTSVVGTVDGLINSLISLREHLTEEYVLKLKIQREDTEDLQTKTARLKKATLASAGGNLRSSLNAFHYGETPTASPQLEGLLTELDKNQNPSTDELGAIRQKTRDLISQLEASDLTGLSQASVLNQRNLDYALQFKADISGALEHSRAIDGYQTDLKRIINEQNTADSQGRPEYQTAEREMMSIRKRLDLGIAAIQKQYAGDSVGADKAVQSLIEQTAKDTEALTLRLDQLVDQNILTQDAADILLKDMTPTELLAKETGAKSAASAVPMLQARAAAAVKRREDMQKDLEKALSGAGSLAEFDRIAIALQRNDALLTVAMEEQAKLELDADASAGDTEALAFRLKEDARERARLRGEELKKQRTDRTDRRIAQAHKVYGSTRAQSDAQQDRIEAQGRQFYGNSRAQSEAVNNDLLKQNQTLEQQLRIQRLIKVYGADSVVVAKARVAEERKVYVATLDTNNLSAAALANHMALWDAMNSVTDATWGWSDAMAGVAAQINGILGALSSLGGNVLGQVSKQVEIQALKAGKTAAVARQDAMAYEIETEGRAKEMGAKNFIERGLIKADTALKLKSLETDAQLEELRANAPSPKPKKGKDSGGGEGTSPFQTFMDSMEGNLGAAALDTGERQAARFTQILGVANEELAKKKAAIDALQGQDLSAAKQTELNRLVREQATLQEFVNTAQRKASDALVLQGDLQGKLNLLMEDFAKNNLDLTTVLTNGVTNVLSSWKTAFSDLFSSLADGTKTGGEALRDFAVAAVRALQSVVAEMLAVYAMKQLLGWLGGMGGGLGDFATALLGQKDGGLVTDAPGMAGGGLVPGNLARDSVPRMLMPDEYVLRASAVQMIGVDNLDRINSMGNHKMASGGAVSGIASRAGAPPLNIWMAPPDQRPIPGANDIIAVITEDMARGGATKRLIKTIQQGR